MNTKSNTYKAILLITILDFCIQNGCARQNGSENNKQTQSEFMKLIDERTAPDLDTLAERSSPDNDYTDPNITTGAFYDILKLRDVGDNIAVPVLEQIIKDDNYRGRIHSYAAAQALFCIGTPEANKVLSQYLLTPKYNARQGIKYIFAYEMDKTKRDAFIEEYHLKNLSQDIKIKLNTESRNKNLNFTIQLTNTSQESYHIRDKLYNLGEMLLFESENGQYFHGLMYALPEYGMEIPKWVVLNPGESREFNIDIDVSLNAKETDISKKYENFALILRTKDFVFGLDKPGKFKVYAIYENQPLTKQSLAGIVLEKVDFDDAWSGRIVSEPVTVNIP